MAVKYLLVALSTVRTVEGKKQRVRFAAKSTPDLTDDEIETLTKLQNSTGKLHFRDPINEGGNVTASEPEVVVTPDYAGQDVSIDNKSVEQLKAFLTFHEVEFAGNASKATLVEKANDKQAELDAAKAEGDADRDGGL